MPLGSKGKSRRRVLAARAWHALAPALGLRALFCAGDQCRRFTVAHRLLRRDGIFLAGAPTGADAWLCSPQCFESALLARIQSQTHARSGAQMESPGLPERGRRSAAGPRMPYHLALLQKGVLQEADLQKAQQHARSSGLRLGEALLSLSLVSEEQLAEAYARENGCTFYKPAPAPIVSRAVLPPALSLRFGAITVHVHAERIVIGFTTCIDRGVLAMATRMSGCRAEACFITERHFRQQLCLDRKAEAGEAPVTKPGAVAHAIARQAAQLGSEQVELAGSGDMLWVRFRNDNGSNSNELLDAVFLIGEEMPHASAEEPFPRGRRLQSRFIASEKNLCAP